MSARLFHNAAAVSRDAELMRRDMLMDCADLLQSLAVSLGEAAWRGSDVVAEIHIREIIATAKTAADTLAHGGRR